VRLDACPRSPAGPRTAASSRCPLVYTEHRQPRGGRNLASNTLQVHDAPETGNALADRKGGGFHPRWRGPGREPAGHVFLGGPRARPRCGCTAARERARADARSLLAGRRLERCPGPDRTRSWRAPRSPSWLCAEGAAAEGRSAPLRLLLAAPRLPRFRGKLCRGATRIYPPRSWASRGRRLLHRATCCTAAVAALPARVPGVVDLWSYGETGYHSLAARSSRTLPARGEGFRLPILARAALAHEVPSRHRPAVDLRDFRATLDTSSRARPRDGPLRLSNLSMTRSTTPGRVTRGSKACGSASATGARAAAGVPPGGAAPARGDGRARLLRGCL